MFTGSIKISELDALTTVLGRDFFPVVQSGSLTTFRVSVTTLNDWFRISGSALSASWASRSLDSTQTISASWASSSIDSIQTISASWASSSISASYARSSSRSEQTLSSSFASQAISASYAPFSQAFQASASWASQSLSSSYAVSASFSPTVGDTVPIGTIMSFASTTVPNNWLECNGDAKSTASFAELYTAIQNNDGTASFGYLSDQFGNRNSSGGYFKIPDFRGEFIRGWDHNRGIDNSRIFGTSQNHVFQSHDHNVGVEGSGISSGSTAGNLRTGGSEEVDWAGGSTNQYGKTVTRGGEETRPRNVAVMVCIKYTNATNFASSGATISGDVVGTLSASNVIKIQNIPVTSSAPTHGDILKYDSGSNVWYPSSPIAAGVSGRSYFVTNPGCMFVAEDILYVYNYDRHSTRRNLVAIDPATNEATYQVQWPQDAWNLSGHVFRKTTDSLLHFIANSTVNLYDYDIDNKIVTRITGSGAIYYDLPVKVSWASGSLRPTIWALYGGYAAGSNGDTPTLNWRKTSWNGASWVSAYVSTPLDIRTVQNGTEYLKFTNSSTNPSTAGNTLMWDYNQIKKRYYLMDTRTGYMHIFTQDTGDIDTHFAGTYISYLKTIAVPLINGEAWSDTDTEKITVDWNPDTGEERGICFVRRGNQNLSGCVTYIYWPES